MEISTAFSVIFELYCQIFNPEGGGKKIFAFDAHRFLEFMCRIWVENYGTLATSREEVLRDKTLIKQEAKKLLDKEDGRAKKLAGELNVCHQKLREVQDALAEKGTTILSWSRRLLHSQ